MGRSDAMDRYLHIERLECDGSPWCCRWLLPSRVDCHQPSAKETWSCRAIPRWGLWHVRGIERDADGEYRAMIDSRHIERDGMLYVTIYFTTLVGALLLIALWYIYMFRRRQILQKHQ